MMSTGDGLSRRSFLRLFGVAATTIAAGGLLQACGGSGSAPAKPAEKPGNWLEAVPTPPSDASATLVAALK